ncbi:MAG: ribosome-binding factor [Acidimicrobiaceae bacterium]|nr:ribosome-binding factor [Acidimicrobiaceae bacterium]
MNVVVREVLAEELERLSDTDERMELLTITAVTVDPDLSRAKVLLASMSDGARAALEADRVRLQAAIGRQLRLKRTPQLSFAVDPAITTGSRIEDILRDMKDDEDDD